MQSQHKTCQNCKKEFILDSQDLDLLSKLKMPLPTFCSECSAQRRLAWRNTHTLYNRPDSVTGDNLISIFHPDTKMNIVSQKYWWSDAWDPIDYGLDFDFSIDFFSQWKTLRDRVPFQALSNSKAVNSDYCNVAEESYDCYLISACWKNERVMYSDSITENKDSLDLYNTHKSEFSYEAIYCYESSKLFYSEKTTSSVDSYFLYDCKGCVNCFMSSNLRNKSYIFNNIQYSKEDYREKIKEYDLGSFETIEKLKMQFEVLKQNAIHRYATMINCSSTTGDNISGVVNSKEIFDTVGSCKDTRYLFHAAGNILDCYYCNAIGTLENSFESYDTGAGGRNCNFCNVVYYSSDVEYSFNCYSCHDLFGCIGLRNKSYCILNKQYTKEEYFEILPKIKQHMNDVPFVDRKGRVYKYGEFFPVEFSPFAYNETVANDFYPLNKEEINQRGFNYRDKENKNYIPTLKFVDIPDNILDISDSIINEVVSCSKFEGSERCTTAFKITKDELIFYKRFGISLPRMCYQCRHKARLQKRNPLRLWPRTCMNTNSPVYNGPCRNTFKTSYSPERPEKVYCDDCYKREVL